jgi:hypothetical protein
MDPLEPADLSHRIHQPADLGRRHPPYAHRDTGASINPDRPTRPGCVPTWIRLISHRFSKRQTCKISMLSYREALPPSTGGNGGRRWANLRQHDPGSVALVQMIELGSSVSLIPAQT